MCKSTSDGGQRCAAHTRSRYQKTSPANPEWDTIAAEYASTPEGAQALRTQLSQHETQSNPRAIARLTSAIEHGQVIRESNQAAAAAVIAARDTHAHATAELQHAINDACELNPDGWAVDPEETLASIEEPAYELLERDSRDAALEYLRSTWRANRDRYRQTDPTNIATRGRYASLMVEAERTATRIASASTSPS